MKEEQKIIDGAREEICENCAKNLKMVRAYFGWKQGELAEKVGTTARHISEIETGKAKLSWTLFLAIVGLMTLSPQKINSPVYDIVFPDEAKQFVMEL